MNKVDIAIVGGAMVGLTLARALKDLDLSVAVISDQPIRQAIPEQPLLRVSAINAANQQALEALNVWQHMPENRLCAYTGMQVWDKDSFGRIAFDCQEIAAPQLGHIVENQLLVNALAQACEQQPNVALLEGRIDKILWGQQETMLMLDNDEVVACRLVVGADGAQSYIRQQAGLPISFKDYGHTAIVANIRCELPHQQVARQVFTPTGPLALLPMADPHTCSIVWSQQHEKASQLLAMADDEFVHALGATANNVLGPVTLISERASFPLTMRYARNWVKDGLVIIGDAAHTVHPLAGQGANLGMQDAFALANCLTTLLEQDKDFARYRYLRPFERARKTEAAKMIAAMDGFKTLFAGNDPLKKFIRGVGLSATNAVPALKRQWMQQAMGL